MNIQIESIRKPFDDPELARRTAGLIGRADAMGLLKGESIDSLDVDTVQTLAERIQKAGIGALSGTAFRGKMRNQKSTDILAEVEKLTRLLEESPAPRFEWSGVVDALGIELVAPLLGISESSIRRYASGDRETPQDIAEKLHYIALVVGDLKGGYNEFGIRRWFVRPRTFLGGRSVIQALGKKWAPDDPVAGEIRKDAAWVYAS
jgi:hypothetical protein